MLLETITSFKKLDSKKFTILLNTPLIQRNCKTKLKYTKKSDCLVGICSEKKTIQCVTWECQCVWDILEGFNGGLKKPSKCYCIHF